MTWVKPVIGRQDGYEEVLAKCAKALELSSTQHTWGQSGYSYPLGVLSS